MGAFGKLQSNPMFQSLGEEYLSSSLIRVHDSNLVMNLIASDKRNIVFLWHPFKNSLHSIYLSEETIHKCSHLPLSEPVKFEVKQLLLSKNGHTLLLVGKNCALIVSVEPCMSKKFQALPIPLKCTYISGNNLYFPDSKHLKILQIRFHPFSNTHVGILSSDKYFRIFDLSKNIEHPEQEFLLSPKPNLSNSTTKPKPKPIAFNFGGDNLWERFTVFFLYSDLSIYFLCPVVPFGSLTPLVSIDALINGTDLAVGSSGILIQKYCGLALSWLHSVFLSNPRHTKRQNFSTLEQKNGLFMRKGFAKAQSIPINDASLKLQGPLSTTHVQDVSDESYPCTEVDTLLNLIASNFAISTAGKDCIIAILTQNGKILLNELSDEVQPMWVVGEKSNFTFYDDGSLCCVSMTVHNDDEDNDDVALSSTSLYSEPIRERQEEEDEERERERREKLRKGKMKVGEVVELDRGGRDGEKNKDSEDGEKKKDSEDGEGEGGKRKSKREKQSGALNPKVHTWEGLTPILIQTGEVDLGIEESLLRPSSLSLFSDPLVPQRFFVLHALGVDAIVQKGLLFASQASTNDDVAGDMALLKVEDREVYGVVHLKKEQETSIPRILGCETLIEPSGDVCLLVWTDAGDCVLTTCPLWDDGMSDLAKDWKETTRDAQGEEEGKKDTFFTPALAELLQGKPPQITPPHYGNDGKLDASSLEGKKLLQKASLHFYPSIKTLNQAFVELVCHMKSMHYVSEEIEKRKSQLVTTIEKNRSSIKSLSNQIKQIETKRNQISSRIQTMTSNSSLNRHPLSDAEKEFIKKLDFMQSQSIKSIQTDIDELEDRTERLVRQKKQILESSPVQAIPKRQVSLSDSQMQRVNVSVGSINDRIEDMFSKLKIAESSIQLTESQT